MRSGGKSFYPEFKEYLPESFADCLHNTFRARAGLGPLPSPVGLIVAKAGLLDDAAQETLKDAGRVITLNRAPAGEQKRLADDDRDERPAKKLKIEGDILDDNISRSQATLNEASNDVEKLRAAINVGKEAIDMLRKEQLVTAELRQSNAKLTNTCSELEKSRNNLEIKYRVVQNKHSRLVETRSAVPEGDGEVTALREALKEKDARIGQLSKAIAALTE